MKCNRTELSRILGVSLPTISSWIDSGMPSKKVGNKWEFETRDCIEWYMNRGKEDDDAEQLKLRKLRAETELAELKAMTEAGLLVPLDEAQRQWIGSVIEFKSFALQLPSRVGNQLLGVATETEIKEILNEAITEALEIFSTTEFECEESEE